HAQPAAGIGEDESPRILIDAIDAELAQELDRAIEQAPLRKREREPRLHAHALPATNRSIPARSGRTATSHQPASRSSAAADDACAPPAVSTTRAPDGRRQRRAEPTILRITASPSRPPSRASRGSCALTSGARSSTRSLGRYGGLLMIRSAPRSPTASSRAAPATPTPPGRPRGRAVPPAPAPPAP